MVDRVADTSKSDAPVRDIAFARSGADAPGSSMKPVVAAISPCPSASMVPPAKPFPLFS